MHIDHGIVDQRLVTAVVIGCDTVVRTDGKPSIAVQFELSPKVPGSHIASHTRVQQTSGRDSMCRQLFEMDRVHLPNANIDRAVRIAVNG